MATRHLLEQGFRSIACFTGPTNINIYTDRLNGYRDAMEESGMPIEKKWIREGMLVVEQGRALFQEFRTWNKPPEAVRNNFV